MSIKSASVQASLTRPFLVGLLAGSILVFAPYVAFARDQSNTPSPASGQQQPQAEEQPIQPPSQNPNQPAEAPSQVQPPDTNQPPPPPPEAPPRPGWRRFGPARSNARPVQPGPPPQVQPDPQQQEQPGQPPQYQNQLNPDPPMPAQLTLQSGTFVTVRVDQYLSSNKNAAGDGFTATLTQPLVVDGIVVAQRGQTLGGRVSEAQKAGRVKGVSRLAVELTDMTLVDGSQVPISTQLNGAVGPTGKGSDAAIVGSTAGVGAAIGAGAGGGAGAAIGAGSGALAATIGVLLTRGRATEIFPETELTFRIASPVAIGTTRAPQAFHYAGPNDYGQRAGSQGAPALQTRSRYGYGPPPPYYYGPGYYYPYYGRGPSFGFYYGPRYGYGPRYYHGPRSYGRGSRFRR